MNGREIAMHTARVHLAEARRRRGTSFFWTLLAWAANARRRAAAVPVDPVQGGLF